MANTYRSAAPGGYGVNYNPQRDAITAALLGIANPPPGNMLPQNDALGPQAAPGVMGQSSPAMAQPALNLPGVMPPGQLPQAMQPQNALAMNPGMQQMPRGGLV
jgi:hypothetical protein